MKTLTLDTKEHFGIQLKPYRKKAGLTQEQLGNIIGCHLSNISHFERGYNTHQGKLDLVFRYARALHFTDINFKL